MFENDRVTSDITLVLLLPLHFYTLHLYANVSLVWNLTLYVCFCFYLTVRTTCKGTTRVSNQGLACLCSPPSGQTSSQTSSQSSIMTFHSTLRYCVMS